MMPGKPDFTVKRRTRLENLDAKILFHFADRGYTDWTAVEGMESFPPAIFQIKSNLLG